ATPSASGPHDIIVVIIGSNVMKPSSTTAALVLPLLQPVNTATVPSSANTSVGASTPAGTLDAVSPEIRVSRDQVGPESTGMPVAEVPGGPPTCSESSTVVPAPVSEMPSAVAARVNPDESHPVSQVSWAIRSSSHPIIVDAMSAPAASVVP